MESNSSVAATIDGNWGSQVTFKINTESPNVLDFFPQVLVFQEVADSKVLSILILIFFLTLVIYPKQSQIKVSINTFLCHPR